MKRIILAASLAFIANGAAANDFGPAIQGYLDTHLRGWVNDPSLVAAIRAQNEVTHGFDQARILQLDQQWRAEVGTADTPTITPVLTNPAAEFLRSRVEDSGGIIAEAFVMDSQGLNVAASDTTSDYWQGDEDKFTQTYPVGPNAVHIGDVEFDESTQSYVAQVSVSVVDPSDSVVVGAITVALRADMLF